MIITKKALPRRTFLRGAGVTLALPLLDAMVPAMSAAPAPVQRLGFVYLANGAIMPRWRPAGDGALTELSPTLKPLEPFLPQVVVPIGLDLKQAEAFGDGNGDHARASAVYLNGVHPKRTEGADVRAATTVDQMAAQKLGQDTPLRSLELALEQSFLIGSCENGYSCAYLNTISWRTPTSPNPSEMNPRVVFQRLFGDGGTGENRAIQLRRNRSLLDFVTTGLTDLQRKLGPSDRQMLTEYVESVREIEHRIEVAEHQAGDSSVLIPERPVGAPESFDEHAKLMFDLLALAFQADITRVFTFMLNKEQSARAYPQIGVDEAHHSISHHGNDRQRQEQYFKINLYQVQLFAHFIDRLKKTSDGAATLLDNSLVLYGGGMSDGNLHDHSDLPLALVGGGAGTVKGGRAIRSASGTPVTNLYVSLLGKVGVPVDEFGDSTGMLSL